MKREQRLLGGLWVIGSLVLVTASAFAQGPANCSVPSQTNYVADVLDEFYYWYRELPGTNPALFDSPEAYLDAVRFRPRDSSFSYIGSKAASDAFFSDSQFIGIGFGSKQLGPETLRVTQVFPGSPASDAGLSRGDTLVRVDGRDVAELLQAGQLGAALGPSQEGYRVELGWRSQGGEERTETLVKRPVTIPTVSQQTVLDIDGRPTGYLHFRNFVRPSTEALNESFAAFSRAGVVDLILDLRYNGGGLIDVAGHLSSLIGGFRTNGRVFVEFSHNDKHRDLNKQVRFTDPNFALDLERLVVITTGASASSSELVINGLKPHMPVTVIGQKTFGKPVGQYGFDVCDKVLFPVSFVSFNSEGSADFFGGIPVTCAAGDELNRPLGNLEEDSLEEAVYFLANRRCSGAAMSSSTQKAPAAKERTYGFQQLVNAW